MGTGNTFLFEEAKSSEIHSNDIYERDALHGKSHGVRAAVLSAQNKARKPSVCIKPRSADRMGNSPGVCIGRQRENQKSCSRSDGREKEGLAVVCREAAGDVYREMTLHLALRTGIWPAPRTG